MNVVKAEWIPVWNCAPLNEREVAVAPTLPEDHPAGSEPPSKPSGANVWTVGMGVGLVLGVLLGVALPVTVTTGPAPTMIVCG